MLFLLYRPDCRATKLQPILTARSGPQGLTCHLSGKYLNARSTAESLPGYAVEIVISHLLDCTVYLHRESRVKPLSRDFFTSRSWRPAHCLEAGKAIGRG